MYDTKMYVPMSCKAQGTFHKITKYIDKLISIIPFIFNITALLRGFDSSLPSSSHINEYISHCLECPYCIHIDPFQLR